MILGCHPTPFRVPGESTHAVSAAIDLDGVMATRYVARRITGRTGGFGSRLRAGFLLAPALVASFC